MTQKVINCAECKREFEYTIPTKYPDTRKYCIDCSAKKKAEFTGNPPKPGTPITDTSSHEIKPKDNERVEYEIGLRRTRSNALASAIELFGKVQSDTSIDSMIKAAKEFEKYIVTGE